MTIFLPLRVLRVTIISVGIIIIVAIVTMSGQHNNASLLLLLFDLSKEGRFVRAICSESYHCVSFTGIGACETHA